MAGLAINRYQLVWATLHALIHMYIIWGCYTSYRHRTEGGVILHYTTHIILFVTCRICVTVQLYHCSKYTVQSYHLDPLPPSPLPPPFPPIPICTLVLIMLYVAVCVTEVTLQVTLLAHHTTHSLNEMHSMTYMHKHSSCICSLHDLRHTVHAHIYKVHGTTKGVGYTSSSRLHGVTCILHSCYI